MPLPGPLHRSRSRWPVMAFKKCHGAGSRSIETIHPVLSPNKSFHLKPIYTQNIIWTLPVCSFTLPQGPPQSHLTSYLWDYLARYRDKPELGPTIIEYHRTANALNVVNGIHTVVSKFFEVLRNHFNRKASARAGRYGGTRWLSLALGRSPHVSNNVTTEMQQI